MPPGRGSVVASAASHRVSLSGSVKKPNTVSGLASIRISFTIGSVPTASVISPSPLFSFRLAAEGLEPLVPELPKELAQAIETLRPGPVETPRAFAPLGQEARFSQHAQVLRDRRPRDVAELRRDRPCGQLGITDQPEY